MEGPTANKVQVKFFGDIGGAAGKTAGEVPLPPDATVYGLMAELAGVYGEEFRDQLFDGAGKLRDDVTVAVNSAIIDREKIRDISLNPGDIVSFFPIFPGGG